MMSTFCTSNLFVLIFITSKSAMKKFHASFRSNCHCWYHVLFFMLKQGKEIPSEFPFEISKIEELTPTNVTLTRCLKGEKIEVLVSMPILASDEEDDDLQESSNLSSSSSDETSSSLDNETSSSSDSCSWYSDETSSSLDRETSSSDESSSSSEHVAKNRRQEYLPLTVTVSKPDGSSMKFACNAYHYAITINTVSVRQPPSGAEEGNNNAYDEGPDFSDLDKNLQEELHKYLEVRGKTPNNMKLLHEYIISKEWEHYQIWLAKLRHFVRKN
ncbi:uncharacterized protein At2g39795, mitochondrial-like [Triticum aestivum]|uniref:uncharacterized protein At2g39795, mitochondrial-like n=1 Tax=Triticum aestivum TaxID=4565 RepID=UPI001D002CD1|nr:uncharacterized protein At2g39795, mitochondrial-like [Triticum aestivum]